MVAHIVLWANETCTSYYFNCPSAYHGGRDNYFFHRLEEKHAPAISRAGIENYCKE
jgi:hypothetical protein